MGEGSLILSKFQVFVAIEYCSIVSEDCDCDEPPKT